MGLKNVSLCRYYAVMPHMCHYADFYAGIKGQPQVERQKELNAQASTKGTVLIIAGGIAEE